MKKVFKIALAIIPLLIGIIIFAYLVKTKPCSQAAEEEDRIRKVRFMKATPVEVQKVAIGYGRVAPAREWIGFCEVKGKIICIGFSLFSETDIKDMQGLFRHLQKAADPLTKYLLSKFSPATILLIKNSKLARPASKQMIHSLLSELNRIIRGRLIHNKKLFVGIKLPDRLTAMMKNDLHGQDVIYANRLLIESVYAKYLHMSQVSGKIKEGSILAKGTVICQIDPTEYDLLIEQKQISLQKNQIQIIELRKDLQHKNKIVLLQERRLQILEAEYQRKEKLLQSNTGSVSEADQALDNYLRQLNTVQEIKNSIELIPIKIKNLEASLKLTTSQMVQARLDRDKTVINAPFDLRVMRENIEINQFVSPGQTLIEGSGIEEAEVLAQFQLKDAKKLFGDLNPFKLPHNVVTGFQEFFRKYPLAAIVTLSIQDATPRQQQISWNGHVTRILGSINVVSQTTTVVVTVKKPYANVIPGIRPPLVKGLYCKVTLLGPKKQRQFCIPHTAYHQGRLLLLRSGKLAIKKIPVAYRQENYVVFDESSISGEQIILSDVFPAIPKMRLTGVDVTAKIFSEYPWFVAANDRGKSQ